MSLFQWGRFNSSAGKQLNWKFDCDFLTDGDWEALGRMAWEKMDDRAGLDFVPADDKKSGNANKFAAAIAACGGLIKPTFPCIVDDVWTTGKTMETKKRQLVKLGHNANKIIGVVVLARGPYPAWVKPVLKLDW